MTMYHIAWEIDHEIDPDEHLRIHPHRAAAWEIWTQIFGRPAPTDGIADPDTACVFTITGPDTAGVTRTLTIDLSRTPDDDVIGDESPSIEPS